MTDYAGLLKSIQFAAVKHRDQRRKGQDAAPYVNHPIEVAELLARVAGVTDLVVLQAAILHDTVEDTPTTPEELEALFGPDVRSVVLEVTDDKSLPKAERKQLQIEHAPHLSPRAKLVKLADKITNVQSISKSPPADWPLERQFAYLDWAERVVVGLRGCSASLESLFDDALINGRAILEQRRANASPGS
jgi:(p)ppGpp synthase/HD superfamily hydrolase